MEYHCSALAASVDKGSERVMEELSQGRLYAGQLRAMLRDDTSLVLSASASDLVEKIMDSFTHSLSILFSAPQTQLKAEDSAHCGRTPVHKDRRGCYKRRKTSELLIKETSCLVEDGHAWRKYGQKVILSAKHPRNYFRCTHKFDQGCQAAKQVQKIQDDPFPLFRTTYFGHHTCLFKSSHQIIIDTNHHDSNSIIWSFDSLGNGSSLIKQESSSKSEASSSSSIVLDSSSDYFVCCGDNDHLRCSTLIDNNLSAISSSVSDYAGDVYSCATASTQHGTMEMDNLIFDEFLEIYEKN